MNFTVDASSLINLDNVNRIEEVCQIRRCTLWVSPLVIGECQPSCAGTLLRLHNRGLLRFLSDDQIPSDLFLKLLKEFELGSGETESIAASIALSYGFCSDDKKARNTASELIKNKEVIGSLRLLKWCVEDQLMNCYSAFKDFNNMRISGGFLPNMERNYFCNL